MVEEAVDPDSDEEIIFQYSSRGESDSGKLWFPGDSKPRDQFDFRITNARVSVETPETGETAIPLPFLSKVRTNTSEEENVAGQRRLKYVSFAVMGLIGLFTLAGVVLRSPLEAIFAGGFWLVIWLVVGGKIEDILTYTDEWRWFEFDSDPESNPRHIRFDRAKPEYDPGNMTGAFKLRMPEEEFTHSQISGVDIDRGSLSSEYEPYALLAALFRGMGANVETPERVNITLSSETTTAGEGGPLQGGYYRCENCGTKLDMATDVTRERPDFKCTNCQHILEDRSGASKQYSEAEMAWAASEEWADEF